MDASTLLAGSLDGEARGHPPTTPPTTWSPDMESTFGMCQMTSNESFGETMRDIYHLGRFTLLGQLASRQMFSEAGRVRRSMPDVKLCSMSGESLFFGRCAPEEVPRRPGRALLPQGKGGWGRAAHFMTDFESCPLFSNTHGSAVGLRHMAPEQIFVYKARTSNDFLLLHLVVIFHHYRSASSG